MNVNQIVVSGQISRISDKLKDKYCKDHNINLIRIPISYSKLRVMPEEWYRSFIAEKLSSI